MLGKKEQIAMSKEIKTAIDRAIELDAANDLAYHALGRWQRRMAEIGGAQRLFGSILFGSIPKGSFEEAVKALTESRGAQAQVHQPSHRARSFLRGDG